jgi:shikimate kinase
MEGRPLALIGMMGAGKSAVGRALAHRLGRPFVDADDALVERTGRSIGEVFEAEGEPGFRAIESTVLAELLTAEPPGVIATGGGVVIGPGNRALLRRHATVIWLRASVDELVDRVGRGRGRPLLADDPAGTLARLLDERSTWYREAADIVVDTDRSSPEDLAERIVTLLADRSHAGARS